MRFYRQKPLHSIGKVWNALSLHLQNDKLAFKWVIPFRVGLGLPTLATDKPQKPFHRPRKWVKAKQDWPSSWWHVRQRAFPSRDALILVDRDVWTARRDSWANKAKCHVALALPGLAGSSLAVRRGGFLPATVLFKDDYMNAHAPSRPMDPAILQRRIHNPLPPCHLYLLRPYCSLSCPF